MTITETKETLQQTAKLMLDLADRLTAKEAEDLWSSERNLIRMANAYVLRGIFDEALAFYMETGRITDTTIDRIRDRNTV